MPRRLLTLARSATARVDAWQPQELGASFGAPKADLERGDKLDSRRHIYLVLGRGQQLGFERLKRDAPSSRKSERAGKPASYDRAVSAHPVGFL
jgi:hypothetical protein